jgi:hypothetical protein
VQVDKTRIEQQPNGFYLLWLKYEFTMLQTDDPAGQYDSQVAKAEANCMEKTYRFPQLHRYREGAIVHSFPPVANEPWQELIPGSVGESLWIRLCSDLRAQLRPYVKRIDRSGNELRKREEGVTPRRQSPREISPEKQRARDKSIRASL